MSKTSIARRVNLNHGKYKHGYSKHPLYRTWSAIMDRCYNKNSPRYASNGAKGIEVYKPWHDINNFIADVGLRPSSSHFFSRIDVDGWFTPDNCHWSTSIPRSNNIQIVHEKSGQSGSAEYSTWKNMRARCNRKTANGYEYYGGRGIKVCDRWQQSFKNFYDDMGKKPSPKHSLDRIDVNGNYTPKNCRWADSQTQGMNKRDNIKLEYRGGVINYKDAMEISGHTYKTLNTRIKSLGWSVEKAMHTPVMNRGVRCSKK